MEEESVIVVFTLLEDKRTQFVATAAAVPEVRKPNELISAEYTQFTDVQASPNAE